MSISYIAIYLRLSDDDEALGIGKNESDSITNQRNVILDYIQKDEELRQPIKEFCDDGYSGVTFKRPAFQRLWREVQENKVSCIIVKDFSRLGRNHIEVSDYVEQIFPLWAVRVIAISERYDSRKSLGGIEVGLRTLLHDLYSKDLSKKIKSVKRLYQEKGLYSGGNIPFGYQMNSENKNHILIEQEAARIVRRIFDLAIQGLSTGQIAQKLNQEGVLTPGAYQKQKGLADYRLKNTKSNLWTATQVRELLQNEAYIGTYVCHKRETVRVREEKRLAEDEYIRHENAHEAIVSPECFALAGKTVQVREKRGSYQVQQSLLRGKVHCGFCGYSMNLMKRGTVPYYKCRMGESCGFRTRIDEEKVKSVVRHCLQMRALCQEENTDRIEERLEDVIGIEVYGADRMELVWNLFWSVQDSSQYFGPWLGGNANGT